MIERWLQISCDACLEETDNSMHPDQTIAEFMLDVRPNFRRFGRRHLCRRCAEAEGRPWRDSPPRKTKETKEDQG